MKRFAFASALMLSAFFLQAQTEKGSKMLSLHNFSTPLTVNAPTNSLGIGFGNIKSEDGQGNEETVNYSVVGFQGSFHYFLIDNLSGGLNAGVSYQTVDDFSETIFLVGPEVRYYIPAGTRNKVYVHIGASFGSYNTTGPDDTYAVAAYDGGVSYALFLSDDFSLDAGLGFGVSTIDEDDLKTSTSGFYVDLGFTYFF
jgi:hypothetical protein